MYNCDDIFIFILCSYLYRAKRVPKLVLSRNDDIVKPSSIGAFIFLIILSIHAVVTGMAVGVLNLFVMAYLCLSKSGTH